MKKLFALFAALSVLTAAFAQEELTDEEETFRTELKIVPRLDLAPSFATSDQSENYFGLQNTGLYTEFSHNFTDNLSFSMLNLWVNETPGDLYRNTFHSDALSWMAYCKLTYAPGNWEFSLGKDYLIVGGFENDPSDYDFFFESNSPLVYNMPITQWGAQAFWTNNSENTSLGLQIMSSPFSVRPFEDGLLSINAAWYGDFGPLSTIWSVGAIGVEKGHYMYLVSLGQRLSFDKWSVTLDWSNTCYPFGEYGNRFLLEFRGNCTSWMDVVAGAHYTSPLKKQWDGELFNVLGAYGRFEFFPLRDSRNLRLHLSTAWNRYDEAVCTNLGVTYCFDFKWK